MKCPEWYRAEGGPKKYGPDMDICKVNNDPLSENQINQMCRNNCVSCCLYRSRHGSARPNSQNQNNSGGSSGVMGIGLIIVAVVIVTKLLGIW